MPFLQKKTLPAKTSILGSQSPELWENIFLLFEAPQFWGLCDDTLGKLINSISQDTTTSFSHFTEWMCFGKGGWIHIQQWSEEDLHTGDVFQRTILITGCYLARILVIIKLTGISKPGFRKKFYNSFVEPGPRKQLSSWVSLYVEHVLFEKHCAGWCPDIFLRTSIPSFCKMKTKNAFLWVVTSCRAEEERND